MAMEEEPKEIIQDTTKRKRKPHRLRKFIWLVIVLVAASVLVLVANLGYVSVMFKEPNQQVMIRQVGCSDAERERFFNLLNEVDRDSVALSEAYENITAEDAYRQDPNCVYVAVLYHALIDANGDAATEEFDRLLVLREDGMSPDSRYTSVYEEAILRSLVEMIGGGDDGIG